MGGNGGRMCLGLWGGKASCLPVMLQQATETTSQSHQIHRPGKEQT